MMHFMHHSVLLAQWYCRGYRALLTLIITEGALYDWLRGRQ
jgi:hypothetical protein